jgi:hypothetical protein
VAEGCLAAIRLSRDGDASLLARIDATLRAAPLWQAPHVRAPACVLQGQAHDAAEEWPDAGLLDDLLALARESDAVRRDARGALAELGRPRAGA